jgi:hypothetical protein
MFFLPYLQETSESRTRAAAMKVRIDRSHYPQAIEIHTSAPVPALEQDVRRALAEVDRRITVRSMISMDEGVARAFNLDRLIARLTVAFGGVALLLACLGLYGVTAYSVARRTREIGLRIAVGGSWQRVVGAILRSALVQVGAGIAIGLAGGVHCGAFSAGATLRRRAVRSARDRRGPGAARMLSRDRRAATRRTRGTHGSGQGTSDRLNNRERLRHLLITVPRSVFPRIESAGRFGVFGGFFFSSASAISIAFSNCGSRPAMTSAGRISTSISGATPSFSTM